MRAVMLRGIIDRADGEIPHRKPVLAGHEHLCLEFEALARQIQAFAHQRSRDPAQPGLGILCGDSRQQPEHKARDRIAGAALPRHVHSFKGTDAEDQRILIFRQGLSHTQDILRMMLPVGIRGDAAGEIRELLERVSHRSLQRTALSAVFLMAQQHDIRGAPITCRTPVSMTRSICCLCLDRITAGSQIIFVFIYLYRPLKDVPVRVAAAVIDKNDPLHAVSCKFSHELYQPLIRFVSRDDEYRPTGHRAPPCGRSSHPPAPDTAQAPVHSPHGSRDRPAPVWRWPRRRAPPRSAHPHWS